MRWLMLCFALLAQAPSWASGVVEGIVRASSDAAIWVETNSGSLFLFPSEGCSVGGYPTIKSFKPGDGIRGQCSGAGFVRHCEWVEPTLPLNLSGERVITLMELRASSPPLWDCRTAAAFEAGHLPGARSWPPGSHMPSEINKGGKGGVVLYGSSEADSAPHEALRTLLAAGKGVGARVFREGVRGWDGTGLPLAINPSGLKALMDREPVILVDVREETGGSRIPGAYSIPLEAMDWRGFRSALGMPAVVFYGSNEKDPRPAAAADKAIRWRFAGAQGQDQPVRVLTGGIPAWQRAGLPLKKGDSRAALELSKHLPAGAVALEDFMAWVTSPQPNRVLVDLQDEPSLKVAKALHIPLGSLPSRLGDLPKDKTLVLFCTAGRRAAVGSALLASLGYRVEYLPFPLPQHE